jgi:hypothetical protein
MRVKTDIPEDGPERADIGSDVLKTDVRTAGTQKFRSKPALFANLGNRV